MARFALSSQQMIGVRWQWSFGDPADHWRRPLRLAVCHAGQVAQHRMEENISGRDQEPAFAGAADQPNRADAVAAEMEKIVGQPHSLQTQKLGR